MMNDDYILKQINQTAQFLAFILSKIFGLSKSGNTEESYMQTNELLKKYLELDIDEIVHMKDELFISNLQKKYKFKNEEFSHLSDILFELANQQRNLGKSSSMMYAKALLIFDYLETNDEIFSIDRHYKKQKIMDEKLDKSNTD